MRRLLRRSASACSRRGRRPIVATLVVAGLSLGAVFERQVLKRVDQDLQVRWDELAAAVDLDADGTPALARDLTDPALPPAL